MNELWLKRVSNRIVVPSLLDKARLKEEPAVSYLFVAFRRPFKSLAVHTLAFHDAQRHHPTDTTKGRTNSRVPALCRLSIPEQGHAFAVALQVY